MVTSGCPLYVSDATRIFASKYLSNVRMPALSLSITSVFHVKSFGSHHTSRTCESPCMKSFMHLISSGNTPSEYVKSLPMMTSYLLFLLLVPAMSLQHIPSSYVDVFNWEAEHWSAPQLRRLVCNVLPPVSGTLRLKLAFARSKTFGLRSVAVTTLAPSSKATSDPRPVPVPSSRTLLPSKKGFPSFCMYSVIASFPSYTAMPFCLLSAKRCSISKSLPPRLKVRVVLQPFQASTSAGRS
mmetsp:Transcript_4357/g.8541  ORF Transcript_4357/g.8541 Transcript_4357/m.8541 type:complete len:240 (+) Transcript_4357:163-882(+)